MRWACQFPSVTAAACLNRVTESRQDADLERRQQRAGGQRGQSEAGERAPHPAEAVPEITQRPDEEEDNADVGHVGVAVSTGRSPDLDETDHRHERSEVPEPAQCQVGTPSPEQHGGRGKPQHYGGCRERLPAGQVGARVGVENRQPVRVDGPAEVLQAGDQRVCCANGERVDLHGAHRPREPLREEGGRAENGRKGQQRHLLEDEPRQSGCRAGGGRPAPGNGGEPPERPPVQQEQERPGASPASAWP